jgi:chromosomal replication initiator protein
VRPREAKTKSWPRQPVLPHSFENFIVGRTNALAREASLALARGRQNGVSPLFLVGPPGNGKSHLAQAVLSEARQNGIERGRHTSAESFTTELVSSIRARQTGGFKRRFREQTDLLVVEDVQFFQGKTATQLELFHTLEHLRGVGARIVLTGDRLPREIPKLDRRLSSQMSSGMVVEVELPDAELRRKLLIAKASAGGVRLPECCLDRLVEAIRGSVRDLEGALIQLVATASLLKRPIDLALTEAALRKVADPHSPSGAIGVDAVIHTVAEFFGVSIDELSSRSRKRSILVPRQLAMFLSRRYTDASLAEIGRALGRDHPAVRNAVRVVERSILERAPLRYQIEELASRIERRRTGTP